MRHASDGELMERVRTGDFAAFDELYNRYSGSIRRFLFSLTWDQDTADDYLQEVFVRLYRARDRYVPEGKLINYLYRIAKNHYLTQCRKTSRHVELPLTEPGKDGHRPFAEIRANEKIEPEVHLMEEYRRWTIRQAIARLPDKQKLVFVMSHFEGMKYDQISEVLGVPVGTVKSRMFTAVSTLKSLLTEEL